MEDQLKQIGINCPKCTNFTHTPIEQVLFGNIFECNSCKKKFTLHEENSKQILQQLQEMKFCF